MITVVFLGRLRDVAGTRQQSVDVAPGTSVSDIIAHLDAQSPGLAAALTNTSVRIVLNKALRPVPTDTVLNPGDELAFLPPVTGG